MKLAPEQQQYTDIYIYIAHLSIYLYICYLFFEPKIETQKEWSRVETSGQQEDLSNKLTLDGKAYIEGQTNILDLRNA